MQLTMLRCCVLSSLLQVTGFILGQHLLCLAAPVTFTWPAFWLFALLFFAIGCLGIDVSFHRCADSLNLCASQGGGCGG